MAAEKKEDKKKGKNGPVAVAMKARGHASAERSNPFEAIWSRRKFDVLGKKRKGEEHRVARSRSEATHKRENTLLKEFEQSAKSSVFHDRRIGERDDTLPEFDKVILRQQREHMLKRKSKYNLSDEEEDEVDVHRPHALSGKDDFDEEVPLDDESDEEGKMILSKKRLSLQSGDFPSETDLPEETCRMTQGRKKLEMGLTFGTQGIWRTLGLACGRWAELVSGQNCYVVDRRRGRDLTCIVLPVF